MAVLDYAGTTIREPSAGAQLLRETSWFLLGCVPTTAFLWSRSDGYHGPPHGVELFIYALFSSATTAALMMLASQLTRRNRGSTRARSVWFCLLAAIILFPAFHGACTRVMAWRTRDPIYVTRIAPLHFPGLWMLLNIAFAAIAIPRGVRFGKRAFHWALAGVAMPALVVAIELGVTALAQSSTGTSSPPRHDADTLYALGALIAPFILVAISFEPLEVKERAATSNSVATPQAAQLT